MDAEGKRAKEMVKNLSGKEKFAHFWYYHRIHVLIAVVAIGFIGWTVWQKVTEIKYDLEIPFYSAYVAEYDERIEKLEEFCVGAVKDINDNGKVDFQILPYHVAVDDAATDPIVAATLSKLELSLAADDYASYIMDEDVLEYCEKAHSDVGFTKVEISNSPEFREIMKVKEGVKIYLVTLELFDRQKDDQEIITRRNNALEVEKFFADKAK